MLETPVQNIMLFLEDKAKKNFSGGVKMTFEDGRPVAFVETTHPDTEGLELTIDFDIAEKVKIACRRRFYGTLFLIYDNGKITHYYYNQVWQRHGLEEMLEGFDGPKSKPKTRLTVVVNR
ncbi:hypothetical protein AGMMS50268_17000 [Spirochaetia bacterium]|nr:hypothetical protein AGMMS50268_17000 [Spirochaetia bacterium]